MVNGIKTCPVDIALKPDLEVHFNIPQSELLEDRVPACVVGATKDWTIQVSKLTISVHVQPVVLRSFL